MKRWIVSALSASCAAAALHGVARADDLDLKTASTTPVATATAANNSPGNILIDTGGSVTVTSGAAATINSANALTNTGGITNSGTTNAFGVVITTPGPFTFTNNAAVTLSGTAGSGNIGVLLTGGATTGNILTGIGGAITVAGDNAIGVSLAAPLTGSVAVRTITVSGATSTAISVTAPISGTLTFAGASSAATAGSTGVLVAAPVGGTVTNDGSVTVGSARGIDANGNTVAGATGVAGIRISSGVGGGFLNDRYYIDATGATVPPASVDTTVDTLVVGTVTTTGSAPALWVGPDATNAPVTIGAVGTGIDAFAVDNHGLLQVNVADVGLAATALRVGGGTGGVLTTLTGGIANQAQSSILANSLDARSTAIDLQAGAVVPQLVNLGAIGAATTALASVGSTPQGPGGVATTIVIEPGATLSAIVNSGTITASSVGKNNGATAILDQQGSLTSLTNAATGSISAIAPGTGGATRAIDLGAGTGAVTFVNSGTITGDVVLGQGATTATLNGGSISGALVFGTSAANSLTVNGTGSFTGALTTPTPIALTLGDTGRLSLGSVPRTVASVTATGNSVLVVPVVAAVPAVPALTVNGAASFTGASTVSLALQSLAVSQDVTVVQANGGITTDHLATLIDASSAPYLFTATAPVLTPTTLSIALARKTADQVGLTGGQANLFNASITALPAGSAEAAAIANLPSAAAVAGAYRQLTPPSFGRAQLRTAQTIADSGFGAAADRLAILADRTRPSKTDDDYGIGLWAQEYGDFNRQAAGLNETTFTTSTFGVAGGVDTTRLPHTIVGIGFVSNFATIHHDPAASEPGFNVPSTTTGVEPYVAVTFKPLFLEAAGLFAHVGYSADRALTIGSISDTVHTNWSGTQLGGMVNVGARLNFGHFRITPSNALSWTSLRQDAYTEQGAGNFALAVARQSDSVTSDTAKLAIALLHQMGDGLLKLEVHGAYTHQFNLAPTETVAQFVSGAGSISLPGDSVHADEKSYGVDVGYTQDTLAIRGGYDRREATGFRDQSVAVVASLGF